MIHYHGGPIWPETDAAKIWKNRHAFVSFARPEQIGCAAESASTFALDNGTFSIWKSGKTVNWREYYEFIEKWHKHPGFDFALIPDVIEGDVKANMDLIDQWPFSVSVGVPVYHLHEPLHWLKFLCAQYPRVAIGSSGEFAVIGTKKWWNRMGEIFNYICDGNGRPECKLHGLRMLDPAVFTVFPFSSCDSTNVAQNCKESSRWTVYNPPNNATRGIVIAERIEAFSSSPAWAKIDIQRNIFDFCECSSLESQNGR